MPTYEYKCRDCGLKFEKFQNMKDSPLEKCPECNGKVQRLISSGAGIIFKGSGSDFATYQSRRSPACGRSQTCCGRETPCDNRPCES
jgi:putative FmdB family regulatory protein